MDLNGLAAAFAVGIAAFGSAIGNGMVISKALESMARQPEMESKIRTTMFIGVGLIEAIPIMAAVIAFILLFS